MVFDLDDFKDINDQYGHSGPGAKLLEEYGFTAENIAARAKELLK